MSKDSNGGGGSHRTQIVIAIIGMMGVLGGALFANWEKVFPSKPEATISENDAATPGNLQTSSRPKGAFVSEFVGLWVNENKATPGITRVKIDARLNQVYVEMWGKCHPKDCEMGRESTSVSDSDDGVLSITWTESFAVTKQTLKVLSDGRLEVAGHTNFTDDSGRPGYHSVYYFKKR